MPASYPPPQQRWTFAPPPVERRWRWVAIVASALGLVLTVTLGILLVVGEVKDAPGLIDDARVLPTVADECATMAREVESFGVGRSSSERAEIVRDQNEAIDDMLSEVESLGAWVLRDDQPAEAWIKDWRALIEARETYANELDRTGQLEGPVIEIPDDEAGHPITDRMSDVTIDGSCVVPDVLIEP